MCNPSAISALQCIYPDKPCIATVLTRTAVNGWQWPDMAAMVTPPTNKTGMSCGNPVSNEVAPFVLKQEGFLNN